MGKRREKTALDEAINLISVAQLRARICFEGPKLAKQLARDELVNARAMLSMEINRLDEEIAEANRGRGRSKRKRHTLAEADAAARAEKGCEGG